VRHALSAAPRASLPRVPWVASIRLVDRKRAMGRAVSAWPLLLCLTFACSPEGDSDLTARLTEVDSILHAWIDSERIPGAVVHVSMHGRTVLERAYGAAALYDHGGGQYPSQSGSRPGADTAIVRLASPRPMTTETVFDLASVTKVMATTMAVMLLVGRGELDVEAPVSTYLEDFVGGGKEAITVRHLLTHRSGLAQWWPTYYGASSADEAYALVRDMPLSWPVGAERHYSDLGFMVLGRMVEEVSRRSLADFMRVELYGPLGLDHTGFRPAFDALTESTATEPGRSPSPDPAGDSSRYAATSHGNPFERRMVHDPDFGYLIDLDPEAWNGWRRRTLVGEVNDGNAFHAFGGVAGHAGLFSTAAELDVLLRLLLDGGMRVGRSVIGPDVVRLFLAPTGDGQALGWQLPSYAPAGSFGHTGFTGTFVLGVPEQGMAIVLLTNRQNVGVDGGTTYPDVGPLQRALTAALTGAR
jgi:serine-type D-Ala-D-Ala carboxypeptidase